MKFSTGIDILEIERMEKSLSNPRFLTRLFGIREIGQYTQKGSKTSFLAGNFCAKEAFSKAIGTGIRNFNLREVEVLRDELGKPFFSFSGNAAAIVEGAGYSFDVSISHNNTTAVANVICWWE